MLHKTKTLGSCILNFFFGASRDEYEGRLQQQRKSRSWRIDGISIAEWIIASLSKPEATQ
jgi:hypothetical protein